MFQVTNLEFNETPIRSEGEMVCLTDLWASAGQPSDKSPPSDWKRKEGKQFIDFVAKYLTMPVKHLWKATSGRYTGSTFAHWQIGLAYAKYLDHELHMRVNETYARVQGGDPTIIDEVFDKQTTSEKKRITKRLEGKVIRNMLTDTLKDHGVVGIGYAQCTDAIYEPLLGGTAKQLRTERNLPVRANVRETMNILELAAVSMAEVLADRDIIAQDINGNTKCRVACNDSAKKVASIL